jgi:hypothetical protein
LADDLENRVNKSAVILEITGELPQVKNTPTTVKVGISPMTMKVDVLIASLRNNLV